MANNKPALKPALKLTLGGAPSTPHFIVGLPGHYFVDAVTPVGGDGELTLEEAQKAHDNPGCHVELCEVDARTIAKARKRQKELRGAAIRASRELAREPDAGDAEIELAADQIAAATGQTAAPPAATDETNPDENAGDGAQEA